MNITRLSRFIVIMLTCECLVITSHAQDKGARQGDNSSRPYISWVNQYPEHKAGEVKQSTVKRVYDFLVQKNKETALSRPVAVLGINPTNYWVLDQGDETLVYVQKNKLEVPKAIKKKENYFTSLVGACTKPNGDILFTDSRLNKVFVLSDGQKKLSVLNDTLKLEQPTGIAYSASTDEVWVVETNAHRVTVLNGKGGVVRRIGSRGEEKGQFNYPTSMCIDKEGDAYIVDAMNFRVQIFHKNGEFVSSFGEAGDGPGSFARPKGIATDTYGNIYVADALFHTVQIFDRSGNFLYSFGRQGREKEEFWMPAGVYVDAKNYIYVADSYNSRVQIFQLINGS